MLSRFPRLCLFLLLLNLPFLGGCATWNRWWGISEAATDDSKEMATQFRPRSERSQPYFLDERARQIERNLGL
ncbi:MAG: hypothetical protein U0935_11070 [Pirellulales bacterium]